jgi:hypothetical protein
MPRMPHRFAVRAWPALLIAGAVLALPAAAQPIKRWVDERGVVHYSDAAPPPGATASPVTAVEPARPLSPAAKAAANQRLREARDYLAQTPASALASAASAPPPAARRASAPQGDGCAAQWARYNAAYACMDPYRLANGGVRPEAFTQCPQLPQPQCPAP